MTVQGNELAIDSVGPKAFSGQHKPEERAYLQLLVLADGASNAGSASSFYGGSSVSGNCGTVTDCYSIGSVTGNCDVGGVVGWNDQSIVGKSYSTANTTGGTSRVGGLAGQDRREDIVSNSFWDTETSGQATSDGGTGEATAEMKSIATFSEVT